MTYLPPNLYAQTPQAFPPQTGMGGQAFPPYPSSNLYPYPSTNPTTLQGLPGSMAGYPVAPPGGMPMSQDSFGPMPQGMPVAAGGAQGPATQGQPVGVYSHASGGFADKNTTLSGGSFWTSWKGLATIGLGLAATCLGVWGIYKNFYQAVEKKSITEFGDDVKANIAALPEKAEKAYNKFLLGTEDITKPQDFDLLTKDTSQERFTAFSQTFDCITEDLRKGLVEEDLTPITNLHDKYMEYAKAIKTCTDESKPMTDDENNVFKAAIETARTEYNTKIIPKLNSTKTPTPDASEIPPPAVRNKSITTFGDEVKDKIKTLPEQAKKAYVHFQANINPQNAEVQYNKFLKTFDFIDKELQGVAEDELAPITNLRKLYTEKAETYKNDKINDLLVFGNDASFENDLLNAVKVYEEKIINKLNPGTGTQAES